MLIRFVAEPSEILLSGTRVAGRHEPGGKKLRNMPFTRFLTWQQLTRRAPPPYDAVAARWCRHCSQGAGRFRSCNGNNRSMTFRFSISFKLLLLILPLVCLPIAVVGYFSIHASVERVNRLVRDEQMTKVESAAGKIVDILEKCQIDMQTIIGLPVIEDYQIARSFRLRAETEFNYEKIVRLFQDFMRRTPYYHRMRYLDRDGAELIAVAGNGVAPDLSDQSGEPYFVKARSTPPGELYISEVTRTPQGTYVVHWARSIYSAWNEFTGVLVIDLDFSKIIDMINAIRVGDSGYAFIVDKQAQVLAHPRFEPYGLSIADAPDSSLNRLVRQMFDGSGRWGEYVFEGTQKVAAYAPIPAMGWAVAVTIPVDEFKKESRAIQTRVFQVVIVTLVFTLLAVGLLSYFILRPVRSLAAATRRIAAGDLSHTIPIHSNDELGDLTRAFNRMVQELSRTQDELLRSEKLVSLGRLSAGVAHEIRNPLNAMKGAIVHLQRRRSDDPLIKEYTQLVSEEIDRLNTFVTEFLCFARQAPPKRVPTDLTQLISSTQQLFEKQALEKRIRFHNRFSPELPLLAVDPHQMEQVLVNLMVNAMDAMPGGGDITFSTFFVRGSMETGIQGLVRIEIRDNGCGIPEDILADIFDPFFSTKETGTGIGLPLSLSIVENHGGRMTVRPREQTGTKATIELPVAPNGNQGAAA